MNSNNMKIMKKVLIAILFVLTYSFTANAQNSIRYFKKHLLCQQGEAMNVLDFDVEWPEYIGGTTVDSLQVQLMKALFNRVAPTWLQAMDEFVASYGDEVKKPLETLPDDDKFCYVDCKIREIGLWKNQFASFEVTIDCTPNKKSHCKEFHHSSMITYDVQKTRCLTREEILRMSRITGNPTYSQQFSALLLKYAVSSFGEVPTSISIGRNIGIGDGYLVIPYVAYGNDMEDYMDVMAYVPIQELNDFLSKEFAKRLVLANSSEIMAKEKEEGKSLLSQDSDLKNVYDTPDEKANFALPKYNLSTYVAQNFSLPPLAKLENASAKALASFVIEADGTINTVNILRPSSPSIDRELVNVIRLMPRWNPAKSQGKAVRSRQFLPLTVRLD